MYHGFENHNLQAQSSQSRQQLYQSWTKRRPSIQVRNLDYSPSASSS
nr:MAG TPA: hypothetical protein [Caudoviricetes sp.]